MLINGMNLAAGLAVQALLIALIVFLQGNFSMSGSAAVFTLGTTILVFIGRFLFLPKKGRMFFLAGALLACLWYPLLFILISAGASGYPKLTPWALSLAFADSFRYAEVMRPTSSFVVSIFFGLLLGLGLAKVLTRWGSRE